MNNQYQPNPYNANYISNQKNYIENDSKNISYTENILKSNIGRKVQIYASFPDSIEWRDIIFKGTLEETGIDHILILDEENTPIILQSLYINFIKFENNNKLNF